MHLGIRGLPQYRRGISPTAVLGPQGALTVPPTLPLDGERVGAVRSGPTGSAIGTLRGEWQCHPHGTARSGPSGSVTHTATWHRAYQSGTLRGEWQCDRYARGRVAVPPTLPLDVERVGTVRSGPSGSAIGTLRGEWQCHPHGTARSGPSGSVTHTATWHRAYQSGTLRGEWQCDRYARGRVAVLPTLPLDVERVGAIRSGPSGSAGWGDLWICGRYADVGAPRQGCAPTPPGTASS